MLSKHIHVHVVEEKSSKKKNLICNFYTG
uniref:Uncharacterized protein n=1 Tax=Anguilla anguilla TaxID=7936 RepID=A0A0E9PEQ1_ANGAN